MKALFAVLMIVGMSAQATSPRRYFTWSCSFGQPVERNSPIQGTTVQIHSDMYSDEAKVVIFPNCKVCTVMPREFTATRVKGEYRMTYVNAEEGFKATVFFGKKPQKVHKAQYGSERGTCTMN